MSKKEKTLTAIWSILFIIGMVLLVKGIVVADISINELINERFILAEKLNAYTISSFIILAVDYIWIKVAK